MVRRILELLALRRDHPAFGGTLDISGEGARLRLAWSRGEATCTLDADLQARRWDVRSAPV
ncbi:MAG: hypothetical protein ABI534_02305 [Chloroflexota bacterium]